MVLQVVVDLRLDDPLVRVPDSRDVFRVFIRVHDQYDPVHVSLHRAGLLLFGGEQSDALSDGLAPSGQPEVVLQGV